MHNQARHYVQPSKSLLKTKQRHYLQPSTSLCKTKQRHYTQPSTSLCLYVAHISIYTQIYGIRHQVLLGLWCLSLGGFYVKLLSPEHDHPQSHTRQVYAYIGGVLAQQIPKRYAKYLFLLLLLLLF